jgi:hypothetical protein
MIKSIIFCAIGLFFLCTAEVNAKDPLVTIYGMLDVSCGKYINDVKNTLRRQMCMAGGLRASCRVQI